MSTPSVKAPPALCAAAVLALWAAAPRVAAAAGGSMQGRCASFVKRLQEQGARTGIPRADLYRGLVRRIAALTGARPAEVHASAERSEPDAGACRSVGVPTEPLLALESVIAKLPPDKVRPSIESCLAALKLIDEVADGDNRSAVRAASLMQSRILGRLLIYLAKDKKPGPGAVETQAEALRVEAGGDLRSSAVFGSAIASCGPLGVDVALIERIRRSL